MIQKDRKYTREHEWVKVSGDVAVIGLSHHAVEQLGDIVFVEIPPVGTQIKQMEPCGVIESVKATSEIFSPLSGKVIEANTKLMAELNGAENPDFAPQVINEDPYEGGWLLKIKPSNLAELDALFTPEGYDEMLKSLV